METRERDPCVLFFPSLTAGLSIAKWKMRSISRLAIAYGVIVERVLTMDQRCLL